MKLLALSLGIALVGPLSACRSKEASPSSSAPQASGAVSAQGEVSPKGAGAVPRIGGTVAAVGDHSVELKLYRSGAIEALVANAAGELASDAALLSVTAAIEGGGREQARLAYSKERGRFEGRCKGKLAPGRADIDLDAKGSAKGFIADAVVLRGPELGGDVVVSGRHSAEVFARPSGEVLAFVSDRTGVRVEGDGNVELTARVRTAAGRTEDVRLVFEPPRGCFAGKASAELAPGPIELGIAPKGTVSLEVGRLERVSLLADAAHGGEVLVAGDYSAEIVLDGKGKTVLAFVSDASGKASADANLDVNVDFGMEPAASVSLAWDARRRCYAGSLSAQADLDVKPIRVAIASANRVFVGLAASLRTVVDARLKAAAKLDGKAALDGTAKLDADAKGAATANVKAKAVAPALTAKVAVAAPKVNVDQKASASTKAGATAGGGAKAGAQAKGSIKVGF
jgi:hypothetical protein